MRMRYLALLAPMTFCAAAAMAQPARELPLAIVNGDTVTTADLDLELKFFAKSDAVAPKPADVLRRMTQNRLIVQEGYRMSLDSQYMVANQVKEAMRSQSTEALLDSVVNSVPATTAGADDKRRQAVQEYVDGLKRRYASPVDSTLLKSLDYASADPKVQQKLRDSDAVLARIPPGAMTVKELSRQIRFIEFHGLEGKADAAQKRDRIFGEWMIEALLNYQAKIQHVADRPNLKRFKSRFEREIMYEETLKVLLDVKFEPTPAQVDAYYRKHLADVTPTPRVKMESVRVKTQAAAEKLVAQVRQGAKLSWLAKTSPDILPGSPPLPVDWVDPEILRLAADEVKAGHVMAPVELMGGWLVAEVAEVERVQPQPLASCRDDMVAGLQGEHTRAEMGKIIARLEKSAVIRTLPGAEAEVARRLAMVRKDSDASVKP
jgi:hypothetical protein